MIWIQIKIKTDKKNQDFQRRYERVAICENKYLKDLASKCPEQIARLPQIWILIWFKIWAFLKMYFIIEYFTKLLQKNYFIGIPRVHRGSHNSKVVYEMLEKTPLGSSY